MSHTGNTDRGTLPTTLDFDEVFVTVFWALSEGKDFMLTNIVDGAVDDDEYEADEVYERLNDDLEEAALALNVLVRVADRLYLHDLIMARAPRLAAYLERITDQD